MIREIQAKTLLSHVKGPDEWFGLKYIMNLYRGCQHQCIYCDTRSLCYGIEDLRDVLVKVNALELLADELPRKRVKGMIGTGSMNDPYGPVEKTYHLTGQALRIIARIRYPVHILTKSDLVLKDTDTLEEISRVHALVSFTVTTADDELARKLEPGAPGPSRRYAAMAELAARDILTGVVMMPILPFIEDSEENITRIVAHAAENGASYIIPSFGMTLRDRQRGYYYNELDRYFPGMREQYEKQFGDSYYAPVNNMDRLKCVFYEACEQYGIQPRIIPYQPDPPVKQLDLF